MSTGTKDILRVIFAVIFILTIYMLPTGIAMLRQNKNVGSTAIINALLGWSIIAWIIALAMCFGEKKASV